MTAAEVEVFLAAMSVETSRKSFGTDGQLLGSLAAVAVASVAVAATWAVSFSAAVAKPRPTKASERFVGALRK